MNKTPDLKGFFVDAEGAVALDWVALTSSVAVIGIGLTYMVYGGETGPISTMIVDYNVELTTAAGNLVGGIGDPPPQLE